MNNARDKAMRAMGLAPLHLVDDREADLARQVRVAWYALNKISQEANAHGFWRIEDIADDALVLMAKPPTPEPTQLKKKTNAQEEETTTDHR